MAYGATPVDGSASPIPMSSAVPDGSTTPLAIAGGPSYTDTGNAKVPVSMYVKDGNNLVEGITTDVAVTGDTAGTLSAKLRGLSKILFDVWDSVNHRLHVTVDNAVALGPATMVASSPVTIASDQSAVKIKGDTLTIAGQGPGVVNAINTDVIPFTDISAYKSWTFQTTGTWSGTITVQGSVDGVNPIATWGYNLNSGTPLQTITANNIITGAVLFPFIRFRMTVFGSNASLVGTLWLSAVPAQMIAMLATQNSTWTVMPGNTANTTPWIVAGSNNNGVQAANTAGNVVLKATPGFLTGAIITTTGTVGLTVYDNASTNAGTQVLVIPANPVVGTRYPVEGWCKNGIVSAGVANCPGVTFFFA